MSLFEQQDQAKIGLRSRPGVRKLARRRKHKVERRAARIERLRARCERLEAALRGLLPPTPLPHNYADVAANPAVAAARKALAER